jgi:peptidylamidoglycolate lyase
MRKRMIVIAVVAISAVMIIFRFNAKLLSVEGQVKPGAGFAAVPGEKGTVDIYGPYEVVADWPKPLSQLPGHQNWTWGTVNAVFAESPNRIFMGQRGELPLLKRPMEAPVPQFGPSLSFPIRGLPFRNAGSGPVASPPGPEGEGGDREGRAGEVGNWQGRYGVDARWEHVLLVLDANGNIVEAWTQWDKLFRRAHAIFINPYDPAKSVWVVDDQRNAIYKFSNDGKQLLQTLGTPNEQGDDDKHFGGPTYLAWLPDGTMFLSDGYKNSRVVKFDKDGNYITAWGKAGNPPNDTRPGYFNTPHGIVVDSVTRRVYVNDRGNHRIQVFDENGKFLDQWPYGSESSLDFLYMSADRHIWASDSRTSKILEYDLEGHFLYAWGSFGDWPGAMWNVHQMSVDQEGNFYVAETGGGRVQKFRPRKGAIPEFLVGQPIRLARQ